MKKVLICLSLSMLIFGCKNGNSKKDKEQEEEALTEERAEQDSAVEESDTEEGDNDEEGWVDLFNGENLDGWIKYGTEEWYVDDDGTLVCESGPDEEYGDRKSVV